MRTATQILAKVEAGRLAKAVEGLAEGTMHVYVTEQGSAHVRGSVINGGGREYQVVLTEGQAFCSCPDALYRKTVCKHAVALALALQTEEEGVGAWAA